MKFRKSIALGVAAATAASLGAAAVVGTAPAGASIAGIPTVTVHMGGGKIGLIGGNTIHAGRTAFRLITGSGHHSLQILRLHRGYTLHDAFHDFGPAFSGNTDAIGRIDDNITFRGGADTKPGEVGWFVTTLRASTFYFLDTAGRTPAVKKVTVVGNVRHRPGVPHQSKLTAFTYGWDATPSTIPAKGTLYFYNQADQPHFLEMQRVKEGTTDAQVRRALKRPGNPPWLLRASTSAGVNSPGHGEMLRYDLPAGEYFIACFWPDRFTGMPHALMGMWKLIHLA